MIEGWDYKKIKVGKTLKSRLNIKLQDTFPHLKS